MIDSPDILIIGGGVTGALLSLMLQDSPYRVLLCDAGTLADKQHAHFDARSIAINPASRHILASQRLWSILAPTATPIHRIQVGSQHQMGMTQLDVPASESAMGHVIEMHRFYQAILPRLSSEHLWEQTRLVQFHPATHTVTLERAGETHLLQPRLIVAADGTDSCLHTCMQIPVQKKHYKQHALVTNLACQHPHHFQAYEYFTPEGPLALLPLEDQRMALVWCVPPQRAQILKNASDAAFISALPAAIQRRVGPILHIGRRDSYPLPQSFLPIPYRWPVVWVGNAAQTLHPVAGQGLNLGLRDIAYLAQCILQYGLDPETLPKYHALRDADRRALLQSTDRLLAIFSSRCLPIRLLRSVSLFALDQTELVKSALIRYASGWSHVPPNLACGLPLTAPLMETN